MIFIFIQLYIFADRMEVLVEKTADNAETKQTSKFNPQPMVNLIAQRMDDMKAVKDFSRRKTEEVLSKLERNKRTVDSGGDDDDVHGSDSEDHDTHGHTSSSHSFSRHLLEFILSQARKGHVNSGQMTHWMTSITWGLAHGTISHSDFETFKQKLSQLQTPLPAQTQSKQDSSACCWFG